MTECLVFHRMQVGLGARTDLAPYATPERADRETSATPTLQVLSESFVSRGARDRLDSALQDRGGGSGAWRLTAFLWGTSDLL